MRKQALAIAFLLASSLSIQAAGGLPYDIKTASCDEILAHTNDNAATKRMAAGVYVHGKHMGRSCAKPDYVRGFQLLEEIGAQRDMVSLLNSLEMKANTGNPFAKSQLRKLEKAGFIKKLMK